MRQGMAQVLVGFRTLRDIPRDSKIILRSVGMLGERIIEVRLGGSAETFKDGDLAVGQSELGMEDMTSDAADMTHSVKTVIDSMTSPENISRMTSSLRNLDETTASMRDLLDKNETKLNATIDNLAAATSDASGLMEDNRAKLERSIANFDSAAAGFARAAANLEGASEAIEETMSNLSSITQKIDEGNGTLGKLLNDPSAYDNLSRSVAGVDSLMEAIKRDPGRYLNFKFTLF